MMLRGLMASNSGGASAPTTWDSAAMGSGVVLSNGNMDALNSGTWKSVLGTNAKSSGKWQFEVLVVVSSGNQGAGVCAPTNLSAIVATFLGNSTGAQETCGFLVNNFYTCLSSGNFTHTHGLSYGASDIITVTLDLTLGTPRVNFYKNGVLADGTNLPTGKSWKPAACMESGDKMRLVVSGLTYPVSGFTAWG